MADDCSNVADQPIVWLNGEFLPLSQASISPMDRGFLYGDGLFETLRAEGGRVLYLTEHLARLGRSLKALRINLKGSVLAGTIEDQEIDLDECECLLTELLQRNGFTQECAAVKILITRGVAAGLGLPEAEDPTICLSARPYHAPEPDVYERGWKLHVVREGFSPPLAGHKSLNYLYFLWARQAATDAGADEAVVLDGWGYVAETAAGSLLVRLEDQWVGPETPFQLPGTTATIVSRLLEESGHPVTHGPLRPEGLTAAGTIWVLNSLMGIMPVAKVDGREVAEPRVEQAAQYRKVLFGRSVGE